MSFVQELNRFPLNLLHRLSMTSTVETVRNALIKKEKSMEDFAALISPAASPLLEEMAQASHQLTLQRFGRIVQLYAPLYLSNECAEACAYCGFSRLNKIARLTLKPEEVLREAHYLLKKGFRHLLLVSGEHPRSVSPEHIEKIVRLIHREAPSISLEVAPQTEDIYKSWAKAGAEGIVLYQETYQRDVYAEVHPSGKKRNFDWRLETAERAGTAGMKRLGIGILLGLSNWRKDALALWAHAQYLLKNQWRSFLTVSLPRIRPAAGHFKPKFTVQDRDFVQLICALRLCLPDVGITLSTREKPVFRNGLIPLGITHLSAGSKTEPGGYERPQAAEEQFEVSDQRSPEEVAGHLRKAGYEPVWKDWEAALND